MHLKSNLSVSGIDNLIKQVKQYKQDLNRKIAEMLSELANQGVEICRAEARSLKINDTGKLIGSISGYTDLTQNKAVIIVNCDYAVFIEFGTGVPGKSAGYIGEAISRTAYKHKGGTQYVTLADGREGWFYPEDDGSFRFTQGQASRPFMYNTVQKLKALIRS